LIERQKREDVHLSTHRADAEDLVVFKTGRPPGERTDEMSDDKRYYP